MKQGFCRDGIGVWYSNVAVVGVEKERLMSRELFLFPFAVLFVLHLFQSHMAATVLCSERLR